MQHVIIGAGPAGIVAAETLRQVDRDAAITVIGNEPEPPYSRMAIPYLLIDQIDEPGTYLRKSAGHFQDHKIELRRARVSGIDTKLRTAMLEDGGSVTYDKLLVATGSRPVAPPIPGIDLPGVHPCWTLADARSIARLATKDAKVVLMGAGFIGCIVLEALATRGVQLTVVEMEDRMVPRMMNHTAGNLIKQWCENKGVSVYTSTKVDAIEHGSGGHALAVRLDNGKSLPADLVISATGVKSNIEMLAGTGIETDTGILVDEHLRSSDPNTYAAGDVAQGKDFSTGEHSVHAIQPTAADHGRISALNMAGRSTVFRGSVNMNVLDTLGLISTSFGLWMGADGSDSVELNEPARFKYLSLQFKDDILVGATSLGMTQHVGILRGLIQSRVKLGQWKTRLKQDPTRIMEAYLGSTQSMGQYARVVR